MPRLGQGRERIVGDLGPRGRRRREEGRLAGVGQAGQADVGDQLQPQPDPHLLAFLAGVGVARGLVLGALEADIAPAAVAAREQEFALAGLDHVEHDGFLVLAQHLGADGDLEDHVLALAAMHLATHAVAAGRGLEMLLVAVVDQGVETVDGLDPDVAAVAAVAPVRPAVGDEFLAPERDGARAAVAGTNVDLGLVEKLHRGIAKWALTRAARSLAA